MSRIKNFNQHINESGPSEHLEGIPVVVKGDKEAAELAKKVIGDGKEPNQFFVTSSNDYMYLNSNDEMTSYSDSPKTAPVRAESSIEVETFGPFESFKDAKKKADDIDLSETTGPRYVMIEDRKTGMIFEKFLKAEQKIVWNEEINDDTKQFGYTDDNK